MYIRMRVLPWSNTVSVGQVGINFSSFGEPASRFTSAIERSGIWKKVRYNSLGWLVRLKSPSCVYKNACYLGVTLFLAWGWDQSPFGEPAVVLLVQLNVREYGRR
jgi:hypothetical protein